MNKNKYLHDPVVKAFVEYIGTVLNGSQAIDFSYRFHRARVPEGFRERFGLQGTAHTLEDLFERYHWNRQYLGDNAARLGEIQRQLRTTMLSDPTSPAAVRNAVADVMDWGLGAGSPAAKANMDWADAQRHRLPIFLDTGKQALESEDPDFCEFGRLRMNAGYTKVYSLLCEGIIIYDGRVGAALCWLVRRFLKSMGHIGPVPDVLAFLWAPGRSAQNRNPSGDGYTFARLGSDGAAWARANVRASWLLEAARIASGAAWCAGSEGLRHVECALFMLGYGLPADHAATATGKSSGLATRAARSAPEGAGDGDRIAFDHASGTFSVAELEEWVGTLGRDYVIIGGVNKTFVEHQRPESLDYWLRARSNRPDTRQATTAVVARIIGTGRFRLEKERWPTESRPRKALVLADKHVSGSPCIT